MPTNSALLLTGLAAGLSVAAPVGPMALLCIQRTLRSGLAAGLSTGLGAVTVNVAYATIVLLGLQQAMPLLGGHDRLWRASGGLFLLWSAVRVFQRRTPLDAAPPLRTERADRCRSAYLTGIAFNAANPLSFMLIVAALSPVVAGQPLPAPGAGLVLAGMATAGAAWWALLNLGVNLMRARLTPELLGGANRLAGALLSLYGVVALAKAWQP